MDGMKKLILTTVAIIIAVSVFALMLNFTKNDIQNQVNENQNKPQSSVEKSTVDIGQDYLFFSYFKNMSYNADVKGFLIDKDGKKYDYALLMNSKEVMPEEALKKAIEKKKNLQGKDFISSGDMDSLYRVISEINTEAEFKSEDNTKDQGTTTIYALKYKDNKPELIKIYSYGDKLETPTDTNALVIRKYFIKKLKEDQ